MSLLRILSVLAFVSVAFAPTAAAPYEIRWDASNNFVRLTGISSAQLENLRTLSGQELQRVFSVTVEQENVLSSIGLPPISGKYAIKKTSIEFSPAFPFEDGIGYRAIFHPGGKKSPVSSLHRRPKNTPERTTVVAQIYPTAEVLPQNLLKFYLHFSAPMSGGQIYEHIHLTEEDGSEVELPFLQIDEELWNPEMTRLTLFLDPGRIKREVRPLEEIGPALTPGKRYHLTIDDAWLDARGAPLHRGFKKLFKVSEPDRDAPNPANWKILATNSGSREPLKVIFADPMDHALSLRMIEIEGVGGKKSLASHETSWIFEPDQPWKTGRHVLLVDSIIEDLAGNNIGKPFEVELEDKTPRREPVKTISIEFEVQ